MVKVLSNSVSRESRSADSRDPFSRGDLNSELALQKPGIGLIPLVAERQLSDLEMSDLSQDLPKDVLLESLLGWDLPEFRPHPWLTSAHLQTLAGAFWPTRLRKEKARVHLVPLPDGDHLVLHDDRPANWTPGGRCVLILHGLAGSHRSPPLVRISEKLNQFGVRTFRLDLRGVGAGVKLAQKPYHIGLTEDVAATIAWIAQKCPGSPLTLVGLSLGGNLTLKLMGEAGQRQAAAQTCSVSQTVDSAVAVNPPTDLLACTAKLRRPGARRYDRYFARLLVNQVVQRQRAHQAPEPFSENRPRTLFEFDEAFTVPVWGFKSAADYYERCSSHHLLSHIAVPALVLATSDDPLVPVETLQSAQKSPLLQLQITDGGGHLGFITAGHLVPDRMWMDWRVVQWILARTPSPTADQLMTPGTRSTATAHGAATDNNPFPASLPTA